MSVRGQDVCIVFICLLRPLKPKDFYILVCEWYKKRASLDIKELFFF